MRRVIKAGEVSQRDAAKMLGVSQPSISHAMQRGKLKSLSLEDVSMYKARKENKDNYWSKRTEVEQARHEELIEAMKALNRRLEVLTTVLIGMAAKEVLK